MTNQAPEAYPLLSGRRTFLRLFVPALTFVAVSSRAPGQSDPKSANSEMIQRFISTFEKRDATLLRPFLQPDIVFRNYGQPEIKGREPLLAFWRGVFEHFEALRFETANQAVNGNIIIAEQIHYLTLPGKKPVPIMNMAIYKLQDGMISAWRDYSDSAYTRKLLADG
jgi:limonene-1,2-epoxide hydrolase